MLSASSKPYEYKRFFSMLSLILLCLLPVQDRLDMRRYTFSVSLCRTRQAMMRKVPDPMSPIIWDFPCQRNLPRNSESKRESPSGHFVRRFLSTTSLSVHFHAISQFIAGIASDNGKRTLILGGSTGLPKGT